ncbi:APC family permease [Nocardioides sp. LHG3406-4]|uniref:APC family permease n=1 Tax=Nocardioides sp. LHG3406-4 TaxID=2804575 RepID=UPI003CF11853
MADEELAPGTTPVLKKGFTFGSALALAFADISPIVALYTVFALGLFAVGPAFFWALPVVLLGQLLVAVCFGEMASRYPFAGSVYQWARHIQGSGAGWFAGWAYMWGLTAALATCTVAGAGFFFELIGVEASTTEVAAGAIVIVIAGSICNMVGRSVLRTMVGLSIVAEIIGSVGLSIILLTKYRVNPFSTLFDGIGSSGPEALWQGGAMLTAVAFVGYSFLGFEAAGSIAEEVKDPAREVPKAMFYSLLGVGVVVILSCFALLLAVPDIHQVVADGSADPLALTLHFHMGDGFARAFLALIVIGFASSFLAVQAAVSRCIWGTARDRGLVGNAWLVKLRGAERLPVNAILLTTIVAIVLILLSGSELYRVLVNFTSIGFYISFGIPVWCLAIARWKGVWVPGPFTTGRWGGLIASIAAAWVLFQSINIAWPRDIVGQPWYIDWSMLLTTVILGAVGAVIYARVAPQMDRPVGERLADEHTRGEASA